MRNSKMLVAARVLLTAIGTVLAACAPATDNSAVEADPVAAESAAPLYISRKQVSTDCGVAATPSPVPGFADRPNEEILDMPPPMANMLAIGGGISRTSSLGRSAKPGIGFGVAATPQSVLTCLRDM